MKYIVLRTEVINYFSSEVGKFKEIFIVVRLIGEGVIFFLAGKSSTSKMGQIVRKMM